MERGASFDRGMTFDEKALAFVAGVQTTAIAWLDGCLLRRGDICASPAQGDTLFVRHAV
jgi:hypothetical protein